MKSEINHAASVYFPTENQEYKDNHKDRINTEGKYMATKHHDVTHQTGWVGWAVFAAIMMMLAGIFQAIFGLAAILDDNFFVVTQSQLLLFDLTTWGWVHLIAGILLFFASASLMAGGMYGRIIGVILAFLSAVVNIANISAYPIWSVVIITIDVLIIYALIAHGHELAE